MKPILYILIVATIICLSQNVLAEPVEKEYGSINAWFNGKEATVENIQLKINEPAEIKVEIISNIDGNIHFELTNPLVTESYKVIDGPSLIDERIDVFNVEPKWTNTYIWMVEPTGDWTNGNAPINIFVQFHKGINEDETVEFTIANPHILDEHYSGPTRTDAPSSTDQPPSQGSPGFGAACALLGIALVVMARRN